ncbi:MAG TPA: DEAD/DEAH box helicase [Pseudonocardia sp.]|uniref:DEAD/DEAH box helicase n=1 Tax=Pseudonocardia sp. TaxID=60912 RepID=UPI002BFF803C|nr:DEAD/DEAH box helicase [Pseudonocardia sp.]HTF51295.1 DEAD/DEAH box helicase [Pseudonocardia sp.]
MAARRPHQSSSIAPARFTEQAAPTRSTDWSEAGRSASRVPSGRSSNRSGSGRTNGTQSGRSANRAPVARPDTRELPAAGAPASPRPDPAEAAAGADVPTAETFDELGVPSALVRALAAQGITAPRPIQSATLPDSLAGRDVLGRGRTGSGKTYAFVLPVLARLAASRSPRKPGRPRALILAPTRELATQIEAAIAPLAAELNLRTLTVFGGVGASPQIRGLRAGVDVLVACPGRLADHIGEGYANLDSVEITVLDEADHMADLGFLPVVRRLLDQTPRGGQRLLFSATLDAGVDVLVRRYLSNPVTHSVDSALSPVAAMAHHVLHIQRDDRLPVLVELTAAPGRTLVFTRTKYGAKSLARRLIAAGVPAVDLHGNLSQNARQRNLSAFSDGSAPTLVATDIAARGIHVDDIALVIHADPPVEHKAYLHRSGRTARGDASGTVITLMTDEQASEVRDLTRRAGIKPTTSRVRPGDQLLAQLAPGERTFVQPSAAPAPDRGSGGSGSRGGSNRGAAGGNGSRTGGPRRGGRGRSSGTAAQSRRPRRQAS